MRYSNCYADAQDALQDGFIKVFQNISSYRAEQHIEAWIRRIMVNTCIDKHRKKNWIASDRIEQDYSNNNNYEEENSEITETLDWTPEMLIQLIQQLPTQYRNVFNLYVIEEYSHQEISKKLDISISTSKSNLSRAKQHLRKAIQEKKTSQIKKGKKVCKIS